MVTLVKYLQEHTGIHLRLDASEQRLADIDHAIARQACGTRPAAGIVRSTEAVYDAFVGFDQINHCGFDRSTDTPVRIDEEELRVLADLAQTIRKRYNGPESRNQTLKEITYAAQKYRDLLKGRRDGIAKEDGRYGVRHTLLRSGQGAIFEVTNSMSAGEMERFRRKTRLAISTIEKQAPAAGLPRSGEIQYKVILGQGGFGKARIARNIVNDQYVAVKKIHPTLQRGLLGRTSVVPPQQSNFSRLPAAKKAVLRTLGDAVIVPHDELACGSKAAEKICQAASISARKQTGDITKTLYSFSELGVATVNSAAGALNRAAATLEPAATSQHLTAEARTLLTKYVEIFGLPPANPYTADVAAQRRAQALALFDFPKFTIKDQEQNRKFRNTLMHHMVRAVARLNEKQFSHNDIKPENFVLSQSASRDVTAKLIDLDLLQDKLKMARAPMGGTKNFISPEAAWEALSMGKGHDAEKSDAFALGVSMRLVDGWSIDEIAQFRAMQNVHAQLLVTQEALRHQRSAGNIAEVAHLNNLIQKFSVKRCTQVRWRHDIGVPQTIQDVIDLLLQIVPGDRLTAREALQTPVFKSQNDFMNSEDFSNHARILVRFSSVVE